MGHKLDPTIVAAFILDGLPDSYRYLALNLESQLETITIQDLSARLLDEESNMEKAGDTYWRQGHQGVWCQFGHQICRKECIKEW
jgi:hypothetical protein